MYCFLIYKKYDFVIFKKNEKKLKFFLTIKKMHIIIDEVRFGNSKN